jgi:hypothetical protein
VVPAEELQALRKQLGPANCRRSTLCDCPILVRWEGEWYLVEPVSASGEYSKVSVRTELLAATPGRRE